MQIGMFVEPGYFQAYACQGASVQQLRDTLAALRQAFTAFGLVTEAQKSNAVLLREACKQRVAIIEIGHGANGRQGSLLLEYADALGVFQSMAFLVGFSHKAKGYVHRRLALHAAHYLIAPETEVAALRWEVCQLSFEDLPPEPQSTKLIYRPATPDPTPVTSVRPQPTPIRGEFEPTQATAAQRQLMAAGWLPFRE